MFTLESRFGRAVRRYAGKRKDLGSIPLRLSFLFKKVVVCGHGLVTMGISIHPCYKCCTLIYDWILNLVSVYHVHRSVYSTPTISGVRMNYFPWKLPFSRDAKAVSRDQRTQRWNVGKQKVQRRRCHHFPYSQWLVCLATCASLG